MRGMISLLPLAFLVAGCAAEIPSPLGADAIKTLRLTDVAVTVAPDAVIWWGNAEHEYVAAHSASAQKPSKQPVVETGSIHDPVGADTAEANALAATPEGKAFVRAKAASRVKEALAGVPESTYLRVTSGPVPAPAGSDERILQDTADAAYGTLLHALDFVFSQGTRQRGELLESARRGMYIVDDACRSLSERKFGALFNIAPAPAPAAIAPEAAAAGPRPVPGCATGR